MNKILLVDDDRELTSLLKELLEMEGFDVLVAYDGEQALELLDDSIDLPDTRNHADRSRQRIGSRTWP